MICLPCSALRSLGLGQATDADLGAIGLAAMQLGNEALGGKGSSCLSCEQAAHCVVLPGCSMSGMAGRCPPSVVALRLGAG